MNTRSVTEYEVWVLSLADMRGGVDKARPVAVFDEKQKAIDYYNSQLAESTWNDEPSSDSFGNIHGYQKVFKKGSPLEWFNGIGIGVAKLDSYQFPHDDSWACGCIKSEWVENYPNQSNMRVPLNPKPIE